MNDENTLFGKLDTTGRQKARVKRQAKSPPEGRFALANKQIVGLPLFDPAASEKRNMNRSVLTTIKRKEIINGETTYSDNKVKIFCGIRLGADDLDCLLAIIYLASAKGKTIQLSGTDRQKKDILSGLATRNIKEGTTGHDDIEEDPTEDNAFIKEEHLRIETNMNVLLKEMGLTNGKISYDLAEARLDRLTMVQYTDYGPVLSNSRRIKAGSRQNLLYYRYDEAKNNELIITLNAVLSRAALGVGNFTKIPFQQYRQLTKTTARILFVRLCAMISFGNCITTTIEKCADLVYFEKSTNKSTTSQRKKYIKEALNSIGCINEWTVEWQIPVREGKCVIYRGGDPESGRPFQIEMNMVSGGES